MIFNPNFTWRFALNFKRNKKTLEGTVDLFLLKFKASRQ